MRPSLPVWWSLVVLMALGLGLAACSAPSPGLRAAESTVVTVDRARFRVHWTAAVAEAYRANLDLRLRRGAMVARGAVAIERATSCRLQPGTLIGDAAMVRAEIDCDGPAIPASSPAGGAEIVCTTVDSRPVTGGNYDVVTLDCVAVQ